MTTNLLQTPRPPGGFRTILADPPWAFLTRSGAHRLPQRADADQHYPVMNHGQLRRLPVREMAAPDCALVMWVVSTHLPQALELGASWGFEYKSGPLFTWRKTTDDGQRTRMGMGYWTRKETEITLLFTRGQPERRSAGVRELIDAPRREHSRKPDEIYERVEQLLYGPYLDLFGRQSRPGWTVWGNDTGRFDTGKVDPQPADVAVADPR